MMNRRWKILILLFLTCTLSHAQKFYLRGGGGIALSTAASDNYSYNTQSGSATIATSKRGGIGTGLPFVLAGGYKLSDHFGFELGVDYFCGFSLGSENNYLNTAGSGYTSDSKWHGQMLSIVPAFVMSFPMDKLKPYARIGLKFGVMNNVISQEQEVIDLTSSTDEIQIKSRDYGGVAIGAQAALGTDLVLNKLLSLFGEIQLDGITYSPKHGKYTEYIKNGIDQLGSMPISEKEWNYVKEAAFSNTGPADQPRDVITRNYTFGNVGLLIGVKVNL